MKQLSDFINSKVVLMADEMKNILSNFQEMILEKGQFILKSYHLVDNCYLIFFRILLNAFGVMPR